MLESKGYSVAFSKGKALLWSSNDDLSTAITIGTRESGLYKISGQVVQALVHETINPCELWYRRLGHLNYNALPGLQKMVTGMPMFHLSMIVFVEVVLSVKVQRNLILTAIENLMAF